MIIDNNENRTTPDAQKHKETGDEQFFDQTLTYTCKHLPSGEHWVILIVKSGRVYAAGWPPTIGDLKDCTDFKVRCIRTKDESNYLERTFGLTPTL